jgi:phosphoenolpyruvate carboxykinase (ATP)
MKPFHELKKLEPGLEYLGIRNIKKVHWNLCSPKLYEQATKRGEGVMSHLGPLIIVRPTESPISTGRAPNDKFIVRDKFTEDKINWGDVNIAYEPEKFEYIFERLKAYMQDRELFIQDVYAGADPKYRLAVRVITEYAWQSLFARNLLIRIRDRSRLPGFSPEFTVIAMPKFMANPQLDDIHSETFILVNFSHKLVLIGGTYYGGKLRNPYSRH